jgi:hypothetical protein
LPQPDPQNALFNLGLAAAHYLAGRYPEAVICARKTMQQRFALTECVAEITVRCGEIRVEVERMLKFLDRLADGSGEASACKNASAGSPQT